MVINEVKLKNLVVKQYSSGGVHVFRGDEPQPDFDVNMLLSAFMTELLKARNSGVKAVEYPRRTGETVAQREKTEQVLKKCTVEDLLNDGWTVEQLIEHDRLSEGGHDLFRTGDKDAPSHIQNAVGEVDTPRCRACGFIGVAALSRRCPEVGLTPPTYEQALGRIHRQGQDTPVHHIKLQTEMDQEIQDQLARKPKFTGYDEGRTGRQVIENALKRASSGDVTEAPFGYTGNLAWTYLEGMSSAYAHALEMWPEGYPRGVVGSRSNDQHTT